MPSTSSDPRGRAGRALLVDDPEEARGLPPRLRRLRSRKGRVFLQVASRSSCRIRASFATGSRSSRQSRTRGRCSRSRRSRRLLRPPLGVRRRQATRRRLEEPRRASRRDAEAMSKAEEAWLPLCGADRLLRVHAGGQARERPHGRLLPPPPGSPAGRSSSRLLPLDRDMGPRLGERSPSRRRVRSVTWIAPGGACDSIRLAVFTVSPQRSCPSLLLPITPATAGPESIPTRRLRPAAAGREASVSRMASAARAAASA